MIIEKIIQIKFNETQVKRALIKYLEDYSLCPEYINHIKSNYSSLDFNEDGFYLLIDGAIEEEI